MSKKGINIPETDFGGDILTPKDMADIEYGANCDYDYVSLSFVQSAGDSEKLRQILLSRGSTAKVIAKIETKKAIESDEKLEAIVQAADGIMVARGDMAVEAGAEVVPIIQRKLIALCRAHAKLCIVATQMFSSMVDNPTPTRAEVSDVSMAVAQGTDAVMLSDETAVGKYPVETIEEMRRVIMYTQNHSKVATISRIPEGGKSGVYDAISYSAARMAEQIEADVIVCQTASGVTAITMAASRPNVSIVTAASNQRVANQLALIYGNSAYCRPYAQNYGLELITELKREHRIVGVEEGRDLLTVLVSGDRDKAGTDTIKVRYV